MSRPRRAVKRIADAAVFSAGKRRPVVVILYPDGLIGLRLYRTRKEVVVDAASIYRQAIAFEAAVERARKAKERKGKRA